MHHPRGRSGLRAPNEGIQHGSNSNRVISFSVDVLFVRSEERRVGKECRL